MPKIVSAQGRYSSSGAILIQAARAADASAFESLVRRYHPALFNFICHFVGEYDLACDILQHVLLQLYLSLPTLRTTQPLRCWLFRVAQNRCINETNDSTGELLPTPFATLL